MNEDSLLVQDSTSEKYFQFQTKWITHLFIKNLINLLKKNNPAFILDVGCGTGYISNKLDNSLNSNIVCCDLNLSRLLIAKSSFQLETLLVDVTYLPFKNAIFDTVLALEVIEHLPNSCAAFEEIKRVSKKNVIISVPNDPFFMMANFLRGKNLKSFGNPPDHLHHFNKKSLMSLLLKYFSEIKISRNAILWLMADAYK